MHINDLLKVATERGASDLHLKVGSNPVLRIDGHLTPLVEVKKLMQEAGIPPWQRSRIPLIYIEHQLACVCGYWVAEAFSVSADQCGWIPVCQNFRSSDF